MNSIVVGDEVVVLARAFLVAGAQSVLGTLWQANPDAVTKLLVTMCEHHQAGMTWAEAMNRAQRDLIQHAVYRDAWFWARSR